MESRMVSSGSLVTAGIVSVNSWYAAHRVFYHIPRKDHVMCGTEGALIKELSWSKLISNGMDRNRLRVFARPELCQKVPAVPCKLHHTIHLHRQPSRVDSLNEDGTTPYIGRQRSGPICQSPSRRERTERQCSIARSRTIDHYIQTAMHLSCRHSNFSWGPSYTC